MTIYRTRAWGGMELRDMVVTDWVTEEAAREAAKKNDWNYGYVLYKVEYTVEANGRIVEIETRLGEIEGGRHR